MSVLSMLALLMAPAAAKLKGEPHDAGRKIRELEAKIVGLKADLAEARRERDDWRAQAEAWRVRRDAAAERIALEAYYQRVPVRPPAELERRQLYQQAAAQLQAQCNAQAQQAQAAQAQYAAMQNAMAYGQGALLGAQALAPDLWCNCVPSRAQVWAAAGDGA
jgi:chromosome segregation ATPase